jgi:hypothetical protein
MLSVIVATHESERSLVPTLSALVPGATAGLIADVTIADAQSTDATAHVADIAGCRFVSLPGPAGARLKWAAGQSRAPWLLFLRAGCVPEPDWIAAVEQFIGASGDSPRPDAAVFRRRSGVHHGGLAAAARAFMAALRPPSPDQGLLIARRNYEALGGHAAAEHAEYALLRRIGRRQIVVLGAAITAP